MTDQTPLQSKAPTKASILTRMLARPRGASLADLTAATGWQPHSVRAFLTGLRKRGRMVMREERRDGATAYRIVRQDADAKAVPHA